MPANTLKLIEYRCYLKDADFCSAKQHMQTIHTVFLVRYQQKTNNDSVKIALDDLPNQET